MEIFQINILIPLIFNLKSTQFIKHGRHENEGVRYNRMTNTKIFCI